ncbi:hypothetical protein WJX74_009825 [Apatococcus lobatus]|uniref:IST1 homolog n=2 Tax=Apatococcus TaxID=904362 RepID=A0AAW1SXJ0_9CHLO
MFHRFNTNKCKTQCQLCVSRIKLLRNKKLIALKTMRKEVADLLRINKQESARIRVEGVIRENLMLQAFEILQLYLELLSIRMALIDKTRDLPPDMVEAISSLIYASQRTSELQELTVIRQLLASKFGKEYAMEAASDVMCRKWHVNENLIRCLAVEAPPGEDKLAMLSEIAQEHGVEWDAHNAALEMLPADSSMQNASPGYQQQLLDITGAGKGNQPGGGGGAGDGGAPGGNWGTAGQMWTPAPTTPPPGASQPPPGNWGTGSGTPPPGNWGTGTGGPPSNRGSGGGGGGMSSQGVVGSNQARGASDSGPSLNDRSAASQGEWADASSAAEAAQHYYMQAKMAAESAQRYASSGPSSNGAAPPGTNLPMPPANMGGSKSLAKSNADIQRAYDAAPGPPTKPDMRSNVPPSAPMPPSDASDGLPSAPGMSGPPAAPANELDDLMKRFEALKKH